MLVFEISEDHHICCATYIVYNLKFDWRSYFVFDAINGGKLVTHISDLAIRGYCKAP